MKIDTELIERGKALKRLTDGDDFGYILREIEDRCNIYQARYTKGRNGVLPDNLILSALDRAVELCDLRDWIFNEIESAGNEILKQQRQSQQDPQDANLTAPSGQPEA